MNDQFQVKFICNALVFYFALLTHFILIYSTRHVYILELKSTYFIVLFFKKLVLNFYRFLREILQPLDQCELRFQKDYLFLMLV